MSTEAINEIGGRRVNKIGTTRGGTSLLFMSPSLARAFSDEPERAQACKITLQA